MHEMCSPGWLGHAALPTSSSGAPNMLDEVSYLQAFGVTHACEAPSVLGRPCAKWFCPVLITEALRSAGLPNAAHGAIGNKKGLTGLNPSSLRQLQPVPLFSSSPSSWMRASPFSRTSSSRKTRETSPPPRQRSQPQRKLQRSRPAQAPHLRSRRWHSPSTCPC